MPWFYSKISSSSSKSFLFAEFLRVDSQFSSQYPNLQSIKDSCFLSQNSIEAITYQTSSQLSRHHRVQSTRSIMHLTRALPSILPLLLTTTLFTNRALAEPSFSFPTCHPKAGKHHLLYHSLRAGQDITLDILDANCQGIYQERVPHRANGGSKPDNRTFDIHGWNQPVTIGWVEQNWSYMLGPIVRWDGKEFEPGECGTRTQTEETVCITEF